MKNRHTRFGITPFIAIGLLGVMLCASPEANAQNRPLPAARPQNPGPPPANAPAQRNDPAGNDVIARAGSTTVTIGELRAYIEQLNPREQTALGRDTRLLSQVVRLMLANQLVLKEALEKKWDQQPTVAAQLERVRQDTIVESYLRAISAPPAGFPSDAETEKVYEANKSAFLVPRQYELQQILVALAQAADKETEEKARRKLGEVQRKLKAAGADFAAIATSDSDDRESATQGGSLGWLAENQLRPEVRGQVIGLAKSAVSEPVRLDDGWHIFRLVDTKPAGTKPFEEVREQLAQRLRDERATANRRAYLAKVTEQTPPAINELALPKLFADPAQNPSSK